MLAAQEQDPDLVAAHTTAAAPSVARWVEQRHGLGVRQCYLLRRGLNDHYAVHAAGGARHVVRLYSIRPRGGFNIDFEAALLAHLDAQGTGVASPVAGVDGRTHFPLRFPEGPRVMALFRHADGSVPETPPEFELTGAELARIHAAASTYAGPPSRYTLDGEYLAARTLQYLQVYPGIDGALARSYQELVQRVLEDLSAVEGRLTRVVCHGDTHGFNNHVSRDDLGRTKTLFFDFDDAGPGYLAYDLCVLPWFRKQPDVCEVWKKLDMAV